jgi:hypothetical protein
MKYKYKRFENCLFRIDEKGKIELCFNGKWEPYDEDDNFDVKMMGTPLEESEASEWQSDMTKRKAA